MPFSHFACLAFLLQPVGALTGCKRPSAFLWIAHFTLLLFTLQPVGALTGRKRPSAFRPLSPTTGSHKRVAIGEGQIGEPVKVCDLVGGMFLLWFGWSSSNQSEHMA